jgi:hypothetical protein
MPPERLVTGDVAKYLCYREAWTRVSLAREQGFPFEAIAILESIMVDRLHKYLTAAGSPGGGGYDSFGSLIRRWRHVHPQPASQGDFSDLRTEVDRWREARNRAVHEIVRSPAGAAPSRIDEFLVAAGAAAEDGAALAQALTNWCERAVRALRKRTQP